ncbi:MAG: hypothetical protein A2992_10400 [Elusimicrobia bacterium RIFCSPLOWO2_01_FULL_59_12]|nr:MAG: hypothetical protein A2992_10400 [Elusimicrobia bacterium RIFCSPLOWO2_01_FULL_59_12]
MTPAEARCWITKNSNILFFVGGFVFDALTLWRIDAVMDLLIQLGYLALIAYIVLRQAQEARGVWQPSGMLARGWHYNVEALHFVYGSLLSAYVVFYLKSSTWTRSSFFLLLVIVLMFANEMPQLRRAGSRMRLGLYALCVASYMNYLLPVMIGRMGGWVFASAMILSAWIVRALLKRLAGLEPNPERARKALGWPPAVVLTLIMVFYALKWIPPVPLSMQYAGIYHQVEKAGNRYELTSLKWPWYVFWRRDDRPFLARPGDQIYCFVRVFGPRRFRDQVYLHWRYSAFDSERSHTSDRIPLSIYGGRGEGFRGYAAKANYQPGRWRVTVETSDGRPLGEVSFEVRQDTGSEERTWKVRSM